MKRNSPKKFFESSTFPMPRDLMDYHCHCFHLEIHPAHVPRRLYLYHSSSAIPASSGNFHCRRFHLVIQPTSRRLYIHLFQLRNSSNVSASKGIGFHCLPLSLVDPSGSVSRRLYLRHSSSAIPASPENYHSPTLLPLPDASLHRTPPLPPFSPLS